MQTKYSLSYFELLLKSHLQENFPEKLEDTEFIKERANQTAIVFAQSIQNGYTYERASELSAEVLFEGLHFSPYSTLIEVLCNEFDSIVPEKMLHRFALVLLPKTASIFETYKPADDFSYTSEYDKLYTELIGSILTIIEENGLQ